MTKITKLLFATAFVLTVASSAFAAGITAKITAVTGKVQTMKKGSEVWNDAKIGDILEEGAIIATGFNSNATLNISSTSIKNKLIKKHKKGKLLGKISQ